MCSSFLHIFVIGCFCLADRLGQNFLAQQIVAVDKKSTKLKQTEICLEV